MTVYIEKPAVNLREELASLRNQGGYEEQQFYFDNLVTNGTFDSDTEWTLSGTHSISGGVLNITDDAENAISYNSGGTPFPSTKTALVTFTVNNIDANFGVRVGLANPATGSVLINLGGGAYYTNSGTYTVTAPASVVGTDWVVAFTRIASHTGSLTIDNISVFETDGTDVVHRMPKGWVPKDFFEDGLLQREGAANDYTVVYDGFDYVIKPTVAPSATTQTCVIGVRK